jgi:hypothetical protein
MAEATSYASTMCDETGEPKCKAPCPKADDSIKDQYVLKKQAPNFWSTALAEAGPIRPQVRVFGCVQADLSLLALCGVPATIQLGVFGQIGYNTGDKCFSWGIDAALGIFFGVKLGGVNFGISINLVGSLSLEEQPYEGGDQDIVHDGFGDLSEASQASFERLNQAKPVEGECPGRRPFELWGAFAEKIYKGLSRDAAIKKRIAEARRKVAESEGYKAYNDYKKGSTDSGRYPLAELVMEPDSNAESFATVETKGKREPKVWGMVGVAESMRAMANVHPRVEHKFARYASHVIDMALTDDTSKGNKADTKKHIKESTGRYLARNVPGLGLKSAAHKPCNKIKKKDECLAEETIGSCEWKKGVESGDGHMKGAMHKLLSHCRYKAGANIMTENLEDIETEGDDDAGDKKEEAKEETSFKGSANHTEPRGSKKAGLIFDDRVFSIPKIMRKSYHSENPYFWREAGISTANLFVRMVGDLQAIFNTYFAGSPNWEGDCQSLPGRHTLPFEGAISNNFWTKNNLASEEGDSVEDEDWPWFQRHWISSDPVKAGENGKSTTGWFTQCSECNRDDVPTIIYPTPLCMSIEQKLAGDPDAFVKHRKNGVKRLSPDVMSLAEAREDKTYKADFIHTVKEPPESVKDSDSGFLLVFDRACNVRKGEHVDKYYECERVYLQNVFSATYPRLIEQILEMFAELNTNLKLIDYTLCEGNTTECHPDPKRTKVAAAQMVNMVRIFALSFLNNEKYSHYLKKHSWERQTPAEGGLLPTVKQVRINGEDVFEKTVMNGKNLMNKLKEVKIKKYDFWNDGTDDWKRALDPNSATPQEALSPSGAPFDEPEPEDVDLSGSAGAEILATEGSVTVEPAEEMKCSKKVHTADKDTHGEGWCQCNAKGEKVKNEGSCHEPERKEHCQWDNGSQLCHAKKKAGASAQALLQMNDNMKQGKMRGRQLLSAVEMLSGKTAHSRKAHHAAKGGPIKAGKPCKKDKECESMKCIGYVWMIKNGHCGHQEASLDGGAICDYDLECHPKGLGKCIGNMGGMTSGTCAKRDVADGAACLRDNECKSTKCRKSQCVASDRTLKKGDVCMFDFSCGSNVCKGNFFGEGKCLESPQDDPERCPTCKCDDSRECVSDLGCNMDANVCYFNIATRTRDQTCTSDKECVGDHCKDGKCSDEPKMSIFGHAKDFFVNGVNKLGQAAGDMTRWAQRKWSSKSMPGIPKGLCLSMAQDFQSMWGVRVVGTGATEKMELVGDAYWGIAEMGQEIRNDTSRFQEAFYDRALGQEKSKILQGLPPVVEYTFTFTIDIESQAPGFCTPSSAALQVIVSKSWTGSTSDTRVFRSRQMCMSLRFAPPTTYFMIDMCYDIPECKGLADIDDESEKAKEGEIITSNVEIGFSAFQFLQMGQFETAATPLLLETGSGSAGSGAGDEVGASPGGENYVAQIDHSGDKDMAEQADSFSKKGKFAEKVKRALQDASLITGQAVGAVMSTKISWAFAQAFAQDDSVTNDGSNGFMRKGVSLVAMVSFFMQALAQAKLMTGPAGMHDAGIWEEAVKGFDPTSAPVPSVSFKLNNELVMEGRGSFKLEKRACSKQERKMKEDTCAKTDHKFFMLSKCAAETCEVGKPVPYPDVHVTFQSWNRAELKICPTC